MLVKNLRFGTINCLVLSFFLFSCGEEPGDQSNDESAAVEETETEITRGLEESAMRPELLGKWKLVDMRMDNEPLPQSIPGNSYLEFLTSGSVALFSEGFEPDTARIKQNGDMLMSDIWDSAQRIDSLTMGRLILSEDLDGTEISYIYTRE